MNQVRKTTPAKQRGNRLFRSLLLPAIAAALLTCVPARADLLVTLGSATVLPNSTGNSFNINVTNTGSAIQNIGAFDIQISVNDTDISFNIGATSDATSLTYLFAGDSFDYNDPGGPFPFASACAVASPQCLTASDLSDSGNGTNLAPGATRGLAHIVFNVANGAALTTATVTLAPFPNTSFSDKSFTNINFTSTPGTITVVSVLVPEPSTWLFLGMVAPFVWLGRRSLAHAPRRTRS
jgi:hypothetical protein